jgi:hypothetical protein
VVDAGEAAQCVEDGLPVGDVGAIAQVGAARPDGSGADGHQTEELEGLGAARERAGVRVQHGPRHERGLAVKTSGHGPDPARRHLAVGVGGEDDGAAGVLDAAGDRALLVGAAPF